MKEEIIEILEALKPHDKEFASIKEYPLALSVKEQKILLDYITNLQDYKQRNEKAIEYIKTTSFFNKSHYHFKQDLLNILTGDKDE